MDETTFNASDFEENGEITVSGKISRNSVFKWEDPNYPDNRFAYKFIFNDDSDEHSYSFQILSANLKENEQDTGTSDTVLYLFDSSGNLMSYDDMAFSDYSQLLDKVILPGWYLIVTSTEASLSGDFVLKITRSVTISTLTFVENDEFSPHIESVTFMGSINDDKEMTVNSFITTNQILRSGMILTGTGILPGTYIKYIFSYLDEDEELYVLNQALEESNSEPLQITATLNSTILFEKLELERDITTGRHFGPQIWYDDDNNVAKTAMGFAHKFDLNALDPSYIYIFRVIDANLKALSGEEAENDESDTLIFMYDYLYNNINYSKEEIVTSHPRFNFYFSMFGKALTPTVTSDARRKYLLSKKAPITAARKNRKRMTSGSIIQFQKNVHNQKRMTSGSVNVHTFRVQRSQRLSNGIFPSPTDSEESYRIYDFNLNVVGLNTGIFQGVKVSLIAQGINPDINGRYQWKSIGILTNLEQADLEDSGYDITRRYSFQNAGFSVDPVGTPANIFIVGDNPYLQDEVENFFLNSHVGSMGRYTPKSEWKNYVLVLAPGNQNESVSLQIYEQNISQSALQLNKLVGDSGNTIEESSSVGGIDLSMEHNWNIFVTGQTSNQTGPFTLQIKRFYSTITPVFMSDFVLEDVSFNTPGRRFASFERKIISHPSAKFLYTSAEEETPITRYAHFFVLDRLSDKYSYTFEIENADFDTKLYLFQWPLGQFEPPDFGEFPDFNYAQEDISFEGTSIIRDKQLIYNYNGKREYPPVLVVTTDDTVNLQYDNLPFQLSLLGKPFETEVPWSLFSQDEIIYTREILPAVPIYEQFSETLPMNRNGHRFILSFYNDDNSFPVDDYLYTFQIQSAQFSLATGTAGTTNAIIMLYTPSDEFYGGRGELSDISIGTSGNVAKLENKDLSIRVGRVTSREWNLFVTSDEDEMLGNFTLKITRTLKTTFPPDYFRVKSLSISPSYETNTSSIQLPIALTARIDYYRTSGLQKVFLEGSRSPGVPLKTFTDVGEEGQYERIILPLTWEDEEEVLVKDLEKNYQFSDSNLLNLKSTIGGNILQTIRSNYVSFISNFFDEVDTFSLDDASLTDDNKPTLNWTTYTPTFSEGVAAPRWYSVSYIIRRNFSGDEVSEWYEAILDIAKVFGNNSFTDNLDDYDFLTDDISDLSITYWVSVKLSYIFNNNDINTVYTLESEPQRTTIVLNPSTR